MVVGTNSVAIGTPNLGLGGDRKLFSTMNSTVKQHSCGTAQYCYSLIMKQFSLEKHYLQVPWGQAALWLFSSALCSGLHLLPSSCCPVCVTVLWPWEDILLCQLHWVSSSREMQSSVCGGKGKRSQRKADIQTEAPASGP